MGYQIRLHTTPFFVDIPGILCTRWALPLVNVRHRQPICWNLGCQMFVWPTARTFYCEICARSHGFPFPCGYPWPESLCACMSGVNVYLSPSYLVEYNPRFFSRFHSARVEKRGLTIREAVVYYIYKTSVINLSGATSREETNRLTCSIREQEKLKPHTHTHTQSPTSVRVVMPFLGLSAAHKPPTLHLLH